jgi:hypothetical protein
VAGEDEKRGRSRSELQDASERLQDGASAYRE